MASSQVEIASSSPPFGCVLRDHNQRDVCRESKWRKFLVKDRPNALLSTDSNRNRNVNENENSWLPNSNPKNIERANLSMAMNPSHSTKKAKTERKPQEETLARSRSLGETPNLGAASLVQIWENRLNRSNSGKNQNSGGLSPSRSDSGLSSNEEEQLSRGSETGDSVIVDERYDSLADWHSDQTSPPSEQPSPCRSGCSDVRERERVRVIDIIKKLVAAKENSNNNDHREQSGSPMLSDHAEQRFFSQAIMSPRVRGRQAFTDLLIQIERERHSELKTLVERRAVSRFAQRGRIQSMLKLRSLQRGMAFQDRHCMRIVSPSPPQMARLPQASSITHLRERFSRQAEDAITSQSNDSENHRIPCSKVPNKTQNPEYSTTTTRIQDEQTNNHEIIFIERKGTTIVDEHSAFAVEDLHEEPCPGTSLTCQETSSENRNLDSQVTDLVDRNLNPFESRSEDRNLEMQEMRLEVQNFDSQDALGTTDVIATTPCDVWDENNAAEELEDNYSQYAEETSYDWITDVSRPRRYWEDLRLEWYHEMLDPNSKNAEIRYLLERGTVTGYLASEFRERMDRLMETRLERQRLRQKHPVVVSQGMREDGNTQLMSPITQNGREGEQQESDEEMGERVEEHEESPLTGQYHEAGDYFDQSTLSMKIPSPSLLRSWSLRGNNHVESTSPRLDDQNDQQCSSSTVQLPSIEMELICELRGQLEQLYHDISDLRQSLKSCMDMQMIIIQGSMKHDVHSGSGQVKNKSGNEGIVAKKGKCCICYEAKVDSLLYRCGHMCTCVKCGHELQWNSGKCPICCAPIVDVVRAFLDS